MAKKKYGDLGPFYFQYARSLLEQARYEFDMLGGRMKNHLKKQLGLEAMIGEKKTDQPSSSTTDQPPSTNVQVVQDWESDEEEFESTQNEIQDLFEDAWNNAEFARNIFTNQNDKKN